MVDLTALHLQDQSNIGSKKINYYSSQTWNYFYTMNIQEIIPGVFLGPYLAAQFHCLNQLREKGIRYIICVGQETEAHFIRPQVNDTSIKYLTLNIADQETENILRYFTLANNFIDEALAKNSKVLVHGKNGNSRSATLVLAYIMQKFRLEMRDALQFVKTKRNTVEPNEGFKAQLVEYEPIYKARQNITKGGCSSSNHLRPKRKLEQLNETICDYNLMQPPSSPIGGVADSINANSMEFSNRLYHLLINRWEKP